MDSTRRRFLASVAGLAGPALGQTVQQRKPNVLFVFSDEHRACSMPGEPLSDVEAPNFAMFARQGMKFNNCISNYPVCSPYRAILLTGLWPYQNGVIDNDLRPRPDTVSLGRTFQSAGYRTGYIGKWHLSGDDLSQYSSFPRYGFHEWHAWAQMGGNFDRAFTFEQDGRVFQPKGYSATVMTDQGINFIERHRQQPWMLMMSLMPPHTPFDDAPPVWKARYPSGAIRLRPNVRPNASTSVERWREMLCGYYGHISATDAEFGRLMQKLEETGQADDTIVVYTSDHGSMIGSHGYHAKRLPFDESCRVPFLIRYPRAISSGSRINGLFSTIDIYPTLCGIAGVGVPSHCVGRDISAALRGDTVRFPETSFLMHVQKTNAGGGEGNPAELFRGVRTDRYTYATAPDGRWCLFDDREDPFQMRNLIDEPRAATLCRDLDARIVDWLKQASDPFPYEVVRKMRSTAQVH